MPRTPIEKIKAELKREFPEHNGFIEEIHHKYGEEPVRDFRHYKLPAIFAVMHSKEKNRQRVIDVIKHHGRRGAETLMLFGEQGLEAIEKCQAEGGNLKQVRDAMDTMHDYGFSAAKLIAEHGVKAVDALNHTAHGRLFGELLPLIPRVEAVELVKKINTDENVKLKLQVYKK